MKVEISPHAKKRLAMRKIPESLILNTLENPDNIMFDEKTGYFIAVKKTDDNLLVVAFLLIDDVIRVISAFSTSKLNIVEKRIRSGRWRLI